MPDRQQIGVRRGIFRSLGRSLASFMAWVLVVGLVTGYFFAPMAWEAQLASQQLAGFGLSLGIAGAVAASVVFGLGGKAKWAAEVALSIALPIASFAALTYFVLWVSPMTVRGRVDAWTFLRLRHQAGNWGGELLGYEVPLGVGVGGAIGAIVGLLARLARRMPRLAAWLAIGFLFACAAGPVQRIASDLVSGWARAIRMWGWSHGISDTGVSAASAMYGAIVGAAIAGFLTHLARRKERLAPSSQVQHSP